MTSTPQRINTRDAVPHPLRVVGVLATFWPLIYAAYRGYYALGGTGALPGVLAPGAGATFRQINAFATVLYSSRPLLLSSDQSRQVFGATLSTPAMLRETLSRSAREPPGIRMLNKSKSTARTREAPAPR